MKITKNTLKKLIKEELIAIHEGGAQGHFDFERDQAIRGGDERAPAAGGLSMVGQADPHTKALNDLEDYIINNYNTDEVLVELIEKAQKLTTEFEIAHDLHQRAVE